MTQAKSWAYLVVIILLGAATLTTAFEPKDDRWVNLGLELTAYRQQLDALRREHGGVRKLPSISFFLFGMGERRKLVYQQGVLRDARTGEEVRRWEVSAERIVPPAYTVALKTGDGSLVTLVEDEEAVWLEEGAKRTALTRGHVSLPSFAGHRHVAVLRVLHQELLVNVVDGKPVPNFMVYAKPWYRDGAMMAMAFQKTGNLGLIKDWVTGLREPFDKNNGGDEEADNPGQVLYLISLVAGKDHPLVPTTLQALKRFEKGSHVEGRSDFASHPVYQTHWAKLGLKSLGLDDPYTIPQVADSYATLCWWAHQSDDRPGQEVIESDDYPYLTWAGCHHTG